MSDTSISDEQELRLIGPVVAITALALAAIVLVRLGQVKSFWWLLMLAVAAPAVVELALEVRRRRGHAPSAPVGRVDPAGPPGGTAPLPGASPPAATVAADSVTGMPSPPEEETQPRPVIVPAAVAQPESDAPSARVLERSGTTSTTSISAIQIPKSTNDLSTCEDALDVGESGLIAAVSDGASSAFMSRAWARVLVSGFVERPPAPTLDSLREWTMQQSERWGRAATDASGERDDAEWWNEASTARGSSATLLGLQLIPSHSGIRWSAIAVGDTIVAQVRPNPVEGGVALIRSFPIEGADTFDSTPELLPTTATHDVADLPALRFSEGTAEAGDSLLIMTDALAQWALRNDSGERPPWAWLLGATGADLDGVVRACRADGSMVDDDVTLARITILPPTDQPGPLR